MEGALPRGVDVGVPIIQAKQLTTILEPESEPGWTDPTADSSIIALYQRHHVACRICNRQVDGVPDVGLFSTGVYPVCGLIRIDHVPELVGVVLGDELFHRNIVKLHIGVLSGSVLEHQFLGLDEVMEMLSTAKAPLLDGETLHDVEQFKNSDSLTIGRKLPHFNIAITGTDRINPLAPVRLQVLCCDVTAMLLDEGRHLLRHCTLVKPIAAVTADFF